MIIYFRAPLHFFTLFPLPFQPKTQQTKIHHAAHAEWPSVEDDISYPTRGADVVTEQPPWEISQFTLSH